MLIDRGSSPYHYYTMYPVHPFLHSRGVLPNWPGSMILMVVVATESVDDMPSKQFTTVPFKPLLTGLTTILDIRGELPWPDNLEKVIVDVLILSGRGIPLTPIAVMGVVVYIIFSGKTMNSHLWFISVVLQISSNWSPTWQTGATAERESSTNPADRELYSLLHYTDHTLI